MEAENKTTPSDPGATCTSNSAPANPSEDAGVEPKNNSNNNDTNSEDLETVVRQSKRRKLCPSALEKCEAIILNSCANSSNGFSFTFDPQFSCGASTPEVTPKFGSFNLVAEDPAAISKKIEGKSELEEGEKKEEEYVEEEVKEKRKFLEILGSGGGGGGGGDDGISADYFEEGSNFFM